MSEKTSVTSITNKDLIISDEDNEPYSFESDDENEPNIVANSENHSPIPFDQSAETIDFRKLQINEANDTKLQSNKSESLYSLQQSEEVSDFRKLQRNERNEPAIRQLDNSTIPNNQLVCKNPLNEDENDWENVEQSPKTSLMKLMKRVIENNENPNVEIRIGTNVFKCHMMVLQCYSDLFMECENEVMVQLPEEKVTPRAFSMLHKWMLTDKPLVERDNIVELFNAAQFLRIKDLIDQCYNCFDDDKHCFEHDAFFLFMEADEFDLKFIKELMVVRISKFFYTLVASTEFVNLTAKNVIMLLNSNSVGVNSEIEIFMSGVYWLNYDWENRQQYVLDIMRTVRFGLFPPWFLILLNQNMDCIDIDRVLSFPEISEIICDAIKYTTAKSFYTNDDEGFINYTKTSGLLVPFERQWLFDTRCKYHHNVTCGNSKPITYEAFLEYLDLVQATGVDYTRHLIMLTDTDRESPICMCSKDLANI